MRYLSKECWTLVTCRAGLQKFNRPSQYNIYIFRHKNDIGAQNLTNMGVVLHINMREYLRRSCLKKGLMTHPRSAKGTVPAQFH